MLDKRAFLVAAAGLAAATTARAQEAVPRNGYNPARTIPHGLVKTSKLFKSPPGFVNGMAVAPEGLWLAQQGISGDAARRYHLPEPTDIREAAWLVDWSGKLRKTLMTNSRNTRAWPMAMVVCG